MDKNIGDYAPQSKAIKSARFSPNPQERLSELTTAPSFSVTGQIS